MNDRGFTAISNEFLCQYGEEHGLTVIGVFTAIVNLTGPAESCTIGIRELARAVRASPNTIRKAIGILEKDGIISVTRSTLENGMAGPNTYTILRFRVGAGVVQNVSDPLVQNVTPVVQNVSFQQGTNCTRVVQNVSGGGSKCDLSYISKIDNKKDIRVDKNTSPTEMIKPATFRTVFWDIFQVNVYTDKAMEFERAFDALGASAYRTLLTGWKERGWSPKNQQGMLDVLARGTLDRDAKIDAPAKEAAPRTWTKAEIEEYHAMEREMGWR
jgi:hypothetical protein